MDIVFVLILIALAFICVVGGGVYLLRRGAKTENTALRVTGIILCLIAVIGFLGLGLLIWMLSQNPYPYS